MIVEVAAIDAESLAPAVLLAPDLAPVLGRDRGFERDLVAVLFDVVERDEHPVDEPDIVAVAQADKLLAGPGRISRGETGRFLHGEIELHARGVAATDHLSGAEQPRCVNIA